MTLKELFEKRSANCDFSLVKDDDEDLLNNITTLTKDDYQKWHDNEVEVCAVMPYLETTEKGIMPCCHLYIKIIK